ncbi:MAG: AMP-binding protein [Clostridia bacterium]|nr:AMP-binding protein [Clostridia bacterium]
MRKNTANPFLEFENPDSPLGFDIPDTSMFGMLKISAENQPEGSAFEYFGTECSYKDLIRRIEEISGAYYALGVRKGDIVTVLMPNTPEAVISIYALNRIGAVANILHPLSAQEEIKNHINRVKSKVLLCVDICSEKVANIIDATSLKKVIVASAGDSMPFVMKKLYALKCIKNYKYDKSDKRRYIAWKDFAKLNKNVKEYIPKGKENEEVSIILHSGGTTGTPKDIMLSNRNFNAFGIQAVLTLRDVSAGDKILAILPIFHGFGLGVCVHVSFCFGACSVLIPQFNAKKFTSIIKKYKPTMLFGVPTLYDALLKAKGMDKIDFSFLKYAVSGGDTLPEKLENTVNSFFAAHNSNVKICEGYGMTEGLAALSLSVGDDYKSRTIGKPLIGTEMCIVEPGTTNVLPADTDGELCVSGPTVMLGYRNNPEETKNTLRTHADGKVWLHTGDMASIDSEGFVYYKLRIKRMMITSGFNVYPTQIERVIEELDYVEKCIVVSIPHQYKKEVAKAYIVLKNGTEKTAETENNIREYCKKKLMHYSVPYKYEFVDLLPKTAYNKIDFMKLQRESAKEAVS